MISGLPAGRAAIKAGYAPTYARDRGSKLLRKPKIKAYIELRRASAVVVMQTDTNITLARLFEELGHIALADPSDICDDSGSVLPLHKMPKRIRRAISSIEVEETHALTKLPAKDGKPGYNAAELACIRTTKVRFWDKLKAIEQIAKLAGYLKDTDPNALSGEITLRWSDE